MSSYDYSEIPLRKGPMGLLHFVEQSDRAAKSEKESIFSAGFLVYPDGNAIQREIAEDAKALVIQGHGKFTMTTNGKVFTQTKQPKDK
jgi:hypothetical protein